MSLPGTDSKSALPLLLTAILSAAAGPADAAIRHRLEIELEPATHLLTITDRIEWDPEDAAETVDFLLNAAFTIESASSELERIEEIEIEDFFSLNSGPDLEASRLSAYRVPSPPADRALTLTYRGVVDFGLAEQKEEYTRGFRDTAGIVGEEGVYLAGSGFWYPFFGDELVEFSLEVLVPEGWHLVSSGSGTSRGEDGRARWDSGGPVDEIYLVGGPLTSYREAAGAVEALVYLRQPDEALAARYLEATAQYLEMYRGLLGPYPYDKFALVENFWETGYGMPSFTLLGPTVIRFPFILTSSYPHEILHNWWGNSVFVDFASGNWSEGLTAYLADHLVQEQRGKGAEYRRAALQKYRNYVQSGEDFPLTAFRSRHSAATEAVGYGKTMMVFHMLRTRVGDESFKRALSRFYRRHKSSRAGFGDLQRVFEETAEVDLTRFFGDWVGRTGAPSLRLDVARVEQMGDKAFRITGRLAQAQSEAAYELSVPAVVATADGPVSVVSIPVADRDGEFEIHVAAQPLALAVDPSFDLFRLLDPLEIPPSLGQIFGEPRILAVLPGGETEGRRSLYRGLLEGWRSGSHAIEIVEDGQIEVLPTGSSVWILGRDNRFAPLFTDGDTGVVAWEGEQIVVGGERVPAAGHSFVAVRRHPRSAEKAVGWLTIDPDAAFPGMERKLPHYGKYSYLAFAGDEPTNVVKGQWAAAESPLVADLRPPNRRSEELPLVGMPPREPLADLPPAFSQARLAEHVRALADPALEGRGLGGAGIRRAADYIASEFAQAGLEPAGDEGYFETVTVDRGADGEPLAGVNVLGALRGVEAGWKGQAIVVSAHYDHLGRGWPDVHSGDEGLVHPGADDNASGVAVLLELARALAGSEPPRRTILFAAFTAEEAGRAGSRHFVSRLAARDASDVRAVVNLDTVGRLFDRAVSIHGAGTADEWQHIFRGATYVTGVESKIVPGAAEASDQMSFIEAGVPGVQLFTGAHDDYHRPGDTVDKVDSAGLVRVATLTKEVVVYLAGREEPLTVTIAGMGAADESSEGRAPAPSRRRVRLGTVPDFAFGGPGVRVDAVAAGSPAERAGLASGDVILAIDGSPLTDLGAYSAVLKELDPGMTVHLEVQRGEEKLSFAITVEER